MTSHLGKKPPIWFHKKDTVVMKCPSNALHYRASLIEASRLLHNRSYMVVIGNECWSLHAISKMLKISAGEADE